MLKILKKWQQPEVVEEEAANKEVSSSFTNIGGGQGGYTVRPCMI